MLLLSACVTALLSGSPEQIRHVRTECLVGIGARRELIFATPGAADRVNIPAVIDEVLRTQGQSVALLHNHPHDRGLSRVDLLQLTKAGVGSVAVIGGDGSEYRAMRGPRFSAVRLGEAHDRVALSLARGFDAGSLPAGEQQEIRREGNHLVCLVLADNGIIVYTARLSPVHTGCLLRYASRVVRARSAAVDALHHHIR